MQIRLTYLSKILVVAAIVAPTALTLSQNLVPNPSFEINTGCPTGVAQIDLAVPWTNANEGSVDYFHTCHQGLVGVPENYSGMQWPFSGDAYAGLITRWFGDINFREYLLAELTEPLVLDSLYLVSFYVSPADERCRTLELGALLTQSTPMYFEDQVLNYTPQVEEYGDYIGDYDSWTLISGCYTAAGGEQFITIGNFLPNSDLPPDPDCDDPEGRSKYYVDEISVYQSSASDMSVELDPVAACDTAVIYPGPAFAYHWQDGSTNNTLTVTQSGTYYVTLTTACNIQYAQIDVTVVQSPPPVVLPNDTLLCAGETVEISLDPEAGDYEWQDGSTSPDYTIASEGVYSVMLDDSCDVTFDTILVSYLDPPGFSLGSDTVVCDGDAFTITLDSTLGDFLWHDGSTLSWYTIEDDGAYALAVTNQCGQEVDTIEVDFVDPLDFSIGPDQTSLCDGDIIVIELDPALGDFLWQDGSTGSTYIVTDGGIVSVVVTNACESAGDEMVVNLLSPPQFTLGPDLAVCPGQLPITFDLSGVNDAQQWEWSDGSGQPLYQINSAGTYSVTISNDCFAESDTVLIIVVDGDPVVNLPSDQSLCPGDSLVLDAAGILGEYLWQDSTTADTLLVTAAGTYSLTVTNACGSGADTVVVDLTDTLAPPDLGADFNLCPGETAVLYANVSGVTYLWQDSSSADSLIITGTSTSTYWLQITDQCTTASDTITVTLNADPPDVDLPASLNLCQGDTVILNAGISGVQYLWSDSSQLSSIAVGKPGTYSLTVSNACGTDADSVLVMDAGPEPTVSLGADTALCPGASFILVPVSSDVQSWIWSDSSTGSTLNVQGPGTIIVNVSNQCGTVSDTLEVSLLPDVPTLDLGADISLCPGESLTLSINAPGVNIIWSDGSIDTSYQVTTGGLVYATISNACGSSSDTVLVETLDPAPVLDLGNDQSLCPGETIMIDPGISGVEYLWQDGSTAPTYQATSPGWIVLTISNDCGSSTDSLEIIADTNGPQVDLGQDILACEGDTVILNAGISGVEYLWTDPTGGVSTSSITAATVSGIYSLQVSNTCGMDFDTIVVEIHGMIPAPSLGPDTTLCDDEVLILTSYADAETEILWYASDSVVSTDVELIIRRSGIYSLTETNHCGSASDTIVVTFESSPVAFDLGDDVVICPGDSIVLHAPLTTDLLTWQDGSHDASFIADQEQVYVLQISNDCGIASDEVNVSFDQNVPVVDLEPSLSICPDQSVTLDVTQAFDASYLWNTGSTFPAITITEPDVYAVTVMTDCYIETDDILIEADGDCDSELFIPNIFSPNGDGVNDEWVVHFVDPSIVGIECRIFDRWGDIVFQTREIPVVWNGHFNSKELNPGVFVFSIVIVEQGSRSRVLSGDITLIR